MSLDVWDRDYQRMFSQRPAIEYLGDGPDDAAYRLEATRVRGLQ